MKFSRSYTMHPKSLPLTIEEILKESDSLVILGVKVGSQMTLENNLPSVSTVSKAWFL